MKKILTSASLILLTLLATTSAFEVGSRCFANKTKVPLLALPERGASITAHAPFATELRIVETSGRWIKVQGKSGEGWAFAGNLSPQKPPEENKSDFLPTAGETGAAVAARPLSSAAHDYAGRQNRGDALADLQWMETFTDAIGAEAVAAYQQENQRGEFAP
jgi:hypothetical protein